MSAPFDADAVVGALTSFQRDSVEHVMDRLYRDPDAGRRFLVADETGLGKSLVARGVIARVIERLQDDPTVDRIDIVYVCSNAYIADQNLKRLNVTGQDHLAFASRLTLLALQSRRLAEAKTVGGKRVNLVSFTPATSFDMGWRTGRADERALLHILLEDELAMDGWASRASRRLLQGNVHKLETFDRTIADVRRQLVGGIDPPIRDHFHDACTKESLFDRYGELVAEIGHRQSVPARIKESSVDLIKAMRKELATASLDTLEPDLVILDEFQRFRHLLDHQNGGEAAVLAQSLFEYGQSRVLLLSATPYKPYTLAEEAALGEDHYSDFVRTLSFLAEGSTVDIAGVQALLADYRSALIRGEDPSEIAAALKKSLLLVMSRVERPALSDADGMLHDRRLPAAPVTSDDLLGYAALRRLATSVQSVAPLEYWKSIPYFANFMDGYVLRDGVRQTLKSPTESADLAPLLAATVHIDRRALEAYGDVGMGAGRLRALAADTVDRGWWQLLWVPPSMPYLEPAGPFANPNVQNMTKRLIFSSWAAAPTAIASLLSYEAERQLAAGSRLTENTAGARARLATRLQYRRRGEELGSTSTLTLFWPHPTLARLGDPLAIAREHPDSTPSAHTAEADVAARLRSEAEATSDRAAGESSATMYFRWPGAVPASLFEPLRAVETLAGLQQSDEGDDDPGEQTGLRAHVEAAMEVAAESGTPSLDPEGIDLLTRLAVHSPGNIAFRALSRVIRPGDAVTERGHWEAAAVMSSGLRSLFSRFESTLLLDQLYPDEPYWRAVLRYCADGNLQAAMDEYLHHLRESPTPVDDRGLMELASSAQEALTMRPSRYQAFDPTNPETNIAFVGRFALRYGLGSAETDSVRQPQVRKAFNSPFWPFILASTSVGQEGIDFHWWCHCVAHWNVPANPVDFEQREGRVNRYGGHAIRRNVAARHRSDAVGTDDLDPWQAAYDAAKATDHGIGDFAPYWVYPGPSKIERQLLEYPLSSDAERTRSLLKDLALYRLALGQPRQEDLLDLLSRHAEKTPSGSATLDLRPPTAAPIVRRRAPAPAPQPPKQLVSDGERSWYLPWPGQESYRWVIRPGVEPVIRLKRSPKDTAAIHRRDCWRLRRNGTPTRVDRKTEADVLAALDHESRLTSSTRTIHFCPCIVAPVA